MRGPHAVTLFWQAEDGSWEAAALRGVLLSRAEGIAAGGAGGESVGETRLIIPLAAPCEDPRTGAPLPFPAVRPGGETGLCDCFFVPGICTEDGDAALRRADARRVRQVLTRDWGSPALGHLTVLAR